MSEKTIELTVSKSQDTIIESTLCEVSVLKAVENLDCKECALNGSDLCHLVPCLKYEREDGKNVGWVRYKKT